jgi:hypothetical protein
MERNNLIKKGIAVAVVILFIGLAFAPSINANINKTLVDLTQNKETPKVEDMVPKEHLFETIIEIANNPDIKKLSVQYTKNLFTIYFDKKVELKQLFFKNFRILFQLLFAKPSLTYDYLESIYDNGTKLASLFSQDDVVKMMESLSITNLEVLDKSIYIIKNNEPLSKKILTLKELNKDIKPDQRPWNFTIICTILAIITLPLYIGMIAYISAFIFPSLASFYAYILFILLFPIMIILLPFAIIAELLGCW